MRTQRTHLSQITIDHRVAPGAFGVRAGEMIVLDVRKCCGCQRMVVLNKDRERERHYCRSCDSFMCDDCARTFKITGEHKCFVRVMEEWYENAQRNLPLLGG